MIRVVLDTNILVSALINRHGAPRQILRAWQEGKFELVTSLPLLHELDRVLHYTRIQRKYELGDDDIYAYITLLGSQGTVVPALPQISRVSRDPTDDKFLSCALVGGAQFVVSGDQDLLELVTFAEIRMTTARDFLTELLRGVSD